MTRYSFKTKKKYSGRLLSICRRPIENDIALDLHLLRFEFEIYWQFRNPEPTLRSEGELACRDIVVGRQVNPAKDTGQLAYAAALGVKGDLSSPEQWLKVADQNNWVEIEFGPVEAVGHRNPFRVIRGFDVVGWRVEPFRHDRSQERVSVAVAADAVAASASTVRRRVDEWEIDHDSLVERTNGGQRRILMSLFLNLWSELD